MNRFVKNSARGAAVVAALIALTIGCGQRNTQDTPAPAVAPSGAVTVAATTSDLPVQVNGPEMTQSVPPPPQVAADPNKIEIVHNLPPIPAHVTARHKRLHLVKYENKYWLQDVDHHCYIASRDNSGHYYPGCYDESGGGTVYPLYYDSSRDDYYRGCSDHDNHYYRSYEDEPNYVYYYDADPIYRRHGGEWNAEYEPVIDAPAYNASWGVSIPLFSAALFMFPPWHSHWWVEGDWSAGGDSFVDISIGRPYFDYYSMPSEYPFVYANTLYVSNEGWRTNPGWYQHGRFDRAAYQSGSYRSFSGYGRAAAAGTLAASYQGSRAFHGGNAGSTRVGPQLAGGGAGTPTGSFVRGGGAAVVNNRAAAAARTSTGSFNHGARAEAVNNSSPANGRSAEATRLNSANRTAAAAHNQGAAVAHTRAAAASARINGANRTAVVAHNQRAAAAHHQAAAHSAAIHSSNRSAQTAHTGSSGGHSQNRQTTHVANRPSGRTAPSSNRTARAPRTQTTSQRSSGGGQRVGGGQRSPGPNHTASAPRAQPGGRSSGGGGVQQSGRGGQRSPGPNHAASAPRAQPGGGGGQRPSGASRAVSAPRAQPSSRSPSGGQRGGADNKNRKASG